MRPTHHPTSRQVILACRIAHEAAELGDDAVAWRKHLLDQLQTRILVPDGAASATLVEFPVRPRITGRPMVVYGDQTPPAVAARMAAYQAGPDLSRDPVTPAFERMGVRSFVRTREQVCRDGDWYASWYYDVVRRPMVQDDALHSQVVVPWLGCGSVVAFTRVAGSPPFTRCQATLVHIAHLQVGHLWRRGRQATAVKLGPRLWQVLDGVCRGLAEKQVAAELSLDPTTVHNYVGQLHRRLGVNSRGELVRAGLSLQRRRGPALLANA